MKPLHFAVEGKNREIIELLRPLTEGFESKTTDETIAEISAQFDAEKTESAPVPVPLTKEQKRECLRLDEEGKAAFAKQDFEKAADCFARASAIDTKDEK